MLHDPQVADANRGGSCFHVICRYERKLFTDIRDITQKNLQTFTQKLSTGIQSYDYIKKEIMKITKKNYRIDM